MPSELPIRSGQLNLHLEPERHVFKVHELNAAIQRTFESDFRGVHVTGEISGCRQAGSGHYYFTLKDDQSQLKCVLFRGTARFARIKPQDGVAVIARGNLEVYQARGEYQLIAESLEPQGAGALQIAFEQLKQKLAAEGLFDPARKRPLPRLPRRIGVITSPSGAVIRDILHVLDRRFQGLHIRLFPAQVQGAGSLEQVCDGLRFFQTSNWPDVVILARGGGSLEDLWTFNQEAVARAIAASTIPVVSAIGHETDFTIADFVADYRAATPSAAAEVIICTSQAVHEQIDTCRARAIQATRYRMLLLGRDLRKLGTDAAERYLRRKITSSAQRTDEIDERLRSAQRTKLQTLRRQLELTIHRLHASDLKLRFVRLRHRAELLSQRASKSMEAQLQRLSARQRSQTLQLNHLSPLRVLERGYAIVENSSGQVLRTAQETRQGELLHVRLHRGELNVQVQTARQDSGHNGSTSQ